MNRQCIIKFSFRYNITRYNRESFQTLHVSINNIVNAYTSIVFINDINDVSIDLINIDTDPDIITEMKGKILDVIKSSEFYISNNK